MLNIANTSLLISLMSWILVVGALAAMPYCTRKTISFGVAVPQSRYQDPLFVKLRRQYFWFSLVLGTLFGIISISALFFTSESVAIILFVSSLALFIIFSFTLYAVYNRKVRAHKRESDWSVINQSSTVIIDHDDKRKPFSLWLYLSHIPLIALTALIPLVVWDSIPSQVPINYTLTGEVGTTASKAFSTFMMLPMTQILLLVIFFGVAFGINNAKRQTDNLDVQKGLRNDRTFQLANQSMLFWLGLLCQLIMLAVQCVMAGIFTAGLTLWLSVALLVFVAIAVILILVRIGQGGYRLDEISASGRPDTDLSESVVGNDVADDDSKWIFFGTFYYDKEDPSIFVEKRVGMGWTNNLANPWSWVMIGGLALICTALVAIPYFLS